MCPNINERQPTRLGPGHHVQAHPAFQLAQQATVVKVSMAQRRQMAEAIKLEEDARMVAAREDERKYRGKAARKTTKRKVAKRGRTRSG